MARVATIIGHVIDAFGDPYDIREARDTAHGWPILVGWPQGRRGKGMGAPRIILTTDLHDHIVRTERVRGAGMDLPIGKTSLTRLRRLVGRDYYGTVAEWWREHLPELMECETRDEFAARHGVTPGLCGLWYRRLLGRAWSYKNGWYREEPWRSKLLADRRIVEIADDLGVALGTVNRLRWMLKKEVAASPTPPQS